MKSVAVFGIIAVAVVLAFPADDKYSDKYDAIDYKKVTENNRLLTQYFNCVIKDEKCTPEGKQLQEHIPEALENECAKCTDKQKEGIRYVLEFLIKEKPDLWADLVAKFDPDNKYRTKYEERAKAEGIKV